MNYRTDSNIPANYRNYTPLSKQSKKARKEFYSAKRGSWGTVSPVTRVNSSTRDRNRAREKHDLRCRLNSD